MTQTQPAHDQYTGMDATFSEKLRALVAATHGELRIESGYRDNAKQAWLYAQAVEKYGPENASKWVAPPGHSNHNRGLAADLAGNLGLAHQLAPQFGLVFPMSWEPWHIEPVGIRKNSSPQAYTNPTGTTNPTQDGAIDTSMPELAAKLTDSFASAQKIAKEGVLAYPTGPGEDTQSTGGAPTGGAGPGGGAAVKGGNVDPKQLFKALVAEGLSPNAAAGFVAIAGRESGYNAGAYNGNRATGDDSYGLFQINLLNGGWSSFLKGHGLADPAKDLLTLEGSARAAKAIYDSSGFEPWGPYKGNSPFYNTNLDQTSQITGIPVAQIGQ